MATQRQRLSTYAITAKTCNRYRHFQRTVNAELFIATLFGYRDSGRFLLHGFVVMPDHIHVLLTPGIDQPTARAVQLIKGGYSYAARQQYPSEIWQKGYHEHRVRDSVDYVNQLAYIANNRGRKNLIAYPHVHTCYPERLAPWPPQK